MIVHVGGHELRMAPRAAFRAFRGELASLPRPLRTWFAFLALLLLLGAGAAARSLVPGDKGLNTTPTFEWGVLIIGYVFLAITTSGLCLASSLGTVFGIERFRPLEKRHAILAVLCLVAAFGIIALDLHYPVRMVFGAVFNPSPSSPMWWMGMVYGVYLCFLLTEVWSMFTGHPRIHQVACLLSSCAAVVAPTTLGAVFAVIASRPIWHGPFTPALMVASAFVSGTALLGIAFYLVHRLRLTGVERAAAVALPSIRLLLGIGLVVVSALVVRELISWGLGGETGLAPAARAVVSGPLAVPFWGIRVVAGLAIPLVLLALPATRTPPGTLAAAALSLVGVLTDRWIFVVSGQIAPSSAVSGVVSPGYAAYLPSPVEVSVLIGAMAFVALAYTLAERYLDMRESELHLGISLASVRRRWPWRRRQTIPVALLDAHAGREGL